MNSLVAQLLNEDVIDVDRLKALCTRGYNLSSDNRSLCWKILLNYIPPEKNQWNSLLRKHRKLYYEYITEIIFISENDLKKKDGPVIDHPLNPDPKSVWNSYFKDNEVLSQIHRDVQRLHPRISFFHSKTDFPCVVRCNGKTACEILRERIRNEALPSEAIKCVIRGLNENKPLNLEAVRKWNEKKRSTLMCDDEFHWEIIERIMFIYYKLNPGQGYVQGMHEIMAPIYYVFATDPETEWREHAEADSFFCFVNLMSSIRNNFLRSVSVNLETASGIDNQIKRFGQILKEEDTDLYYVLTCNSINFECFAFRWLRLLLSQEFILEDVLIAWDYLFACENPLDLLLYICVAMVCAQRDKLISGNFSSIMKLLQNYPSDVDIRDLIRLAYCIKNRKTKFYKNNV